MPLARYFERGIEKPLESGVIIIAHDLSETQEIYP
jgi:hypothetical protein